MDTVKKTFLSVIVLLSLLMPFADLMTHGDSDIKNRWISEVEQVLSAFDTHYVYPETALEMRSIIQQKSALGEYQSIDSLATLLVELQADLREVSNDGHISLHQKADIAEPLNHLIPITQSQEKILTSLEPLENSVSTVGYIRLDKFHPSELQKERFIAAMNDISSADSMIVDLRENGGGDPDFTAFVSSYFLAENYHLWSIVDRDSEVVFDAKTASPRPLEIKPFAGKLCILISFKTYSAAEAFAYTLKHSARAVIIGEATGGGAHLVDMISVNDQLAVRMPLARAYSPITKANWEGTGVIPDIKVNAAQALSRAKEYLAE
ncbi:MAG: hypothetical protein ACI9SP_001691 [Arenicella sp.]|jgi:hypothetical protein